MNKLYYTAYTSKSLVNNTTYVLYYLLWWGLESAADSPSELCRECADAADTELPYPDA